VVRPALVGLSLLLAGGARGAVKFGPVGMVTRAEIEAVAP
jgi:hypothetical protein